MEEQAKKGHVFFYRTWVLVSPCHGEECSAERARSMSALKQDVRNMAHSYAHVAAKWVAARDGVAASDPIWEEFLLIRDMDLDEGVALAERYGQRSVIVKAGSDHLELCTRDFTEKDGTRHHLRDLLKGTPLARSTEMTDAEIRALFTDRVSSPLDEVFERDTLRLQDVCVVEPPRPSYFASGPRYVSVLE